MCGRQDIWALMIAASMCRPGNTFVLRKQRGELFGQPVPRTGAEGRDCRQGIIYLTVAGICDRKGTASGSGCIWAEAF